MFKVSNAIPYMIAHVIALLPCVLICFMFYRVDVVEVSC